jgi:protease IV
MKEFFKFMLASMLGFILLMLIFSFISFGILAGLMSFAEKKTVEVKDGTVLLIELKDPIPDRTPQTPFIPDFSGMSFRTFLGLNDILRNIDEAAKDDRIKGIVLKLDMVPAGIATLGEIRSALTDFRNNGKFIYCYGENMSQGAYYLASVADKVYLHPMGLVDFKGLNAQLVFLKGTFDKLDIDMQVVRHGKFKSAVEPLIQDKMSPENREQLNTLISSVWQSMVEEIAISRGLEVDELNSLADRLISYAAGDAFEAGLIDGLVYRDEFRQFYMQLAGIEDDEDERLLSLTKYNRSRKESEITGDRIAVIYASGQIGGGKGSDDEVGADRFAETIQQARENEKVKAVVLRINSPGGDALASDVVWRELKLTQEVKPLIVSMGDVAASGGYWIASASEKIVASPFTLTGSIGVFGVIPNFGDFMRDRIGITYDNVQTNRNAGFPSVVRPLTAFERELLQGKVDEIYELFLKRVSDNRDMTPMQVDLIGEGRIWSGKDAQRLGLVDEMGGLQHAINLAAEISGLEKYRLLELPRQKDIFEQIIEDLSSGVYASILKAELGPLYQDFLYSKAALGWEGVQARLPYRMVIE